VQQRDAEGGPGSQDQGLSLHHQALGFPCATHKAMSQQTLFDATQAAREKELGMARAQSNRSEVLANALDVAILIGRNNAEVTIDDVFITMAAFDMHPELLGNAAGSVFRFMSLFEFTGRWVKSKRVSNHGRYIRVWRLK
jgi:hypothetical protein